MIDPDMPQRLRQAREQKGWSYRRMAAATHQSYSLLAHMEAGRRPVTRAVVTAYERALGVSLATADTWPDDPIRAAHHWLLDGPHPAATHRAAGRRIGAELVTALNDRVIALRHADDTTAAADLYPTVASELDIALDTARHCNAGAHHCWLWTVVAELSQLAGWLASDLGRGRRAVNHYVTGATVAPDRLTAAQCWSSLAYHLANTHHAVDGLLIARTAAGGAGENVTPLVSTLLHERVAWSAAKAGDTAQCRRALRLADDTFAASKGSSDLEPEWVYWLDRTEIDIMAARCELTLGHPQAAVPLLENALTAYPSNHAREVALYRTYAAEAYRIIGDHANADRHIAAIEATNVRSARIDERLTHI